MARLAVLELFSGIGGLAAAVGRHARVVAALDIHRGALAVAARNFDHPQIACTLESISAERLRAYGADLWWLSPPCQPFTRRGLRRDLGDRRTRPLLAMAERIAEARPRYVALENVPGFQGSDAHRRFVGALERAGYATVREHVLCPAELGMPNRRRRYYLVAARGALAPLSAPRIPRELDACLDGAAATDPSLRVEPELERRFAGALHVVSRDDPGAVTSCFTSAYGRSPVRSGSYLRTAAGLRRFSPREVLRLLGFPATYELPPDLPPERAWPLVGNSLSLPAVRAVLSTVPELAEVTQVEESWPAS